MLSIKGTETEKNLLKAFAGESQARNRYTYYAEQAKKDGMIKVSMQFEETANHEKEHAKRFFSFLEGGIEEIIANFPAGKIRSTIENLKASALGEHEEHSHLYPLFAKIARNEGFNKIAELFENISVAEQQHEKQFLNLIKKIEDNSMFKSQDNNEESWRCLNCGYIHKGNEAPNVCSVCMYNRSYFEIINEK